MADESKNGGSGVCVALDVGDTTAKVAVFHGERLMVIANEQGNRVTPCAVSFTEHELLVGEAAGRKAAKNAKNTILGWRWFIGRKFTSEEVAALAKVSALCATPAGHAPSTKHWHTVAPGAWLGVRSCVPGAVVCCSTLSSQRVLWWRRNRAVAADRVTRLSVASALLLS